MLRILQNNSSRFLFKQNIIIKICLVILLFSTGIYFGKKVTYNELCRLYDNIYNGGYYASVEYLNSKGKLSALHLRSSGYRWPMKDKDGNVSIREQDEFITQQSVGYDIGNLMLIDSSVSKSFSFSFPNAICPSSVVVLQWPRNMQGTYGQFENGKEVIYSVDSKSDGTLSYTVDELKEQHIYSIVASWGTYYGEYSFLVSSNIEDRSWWAIDKT